MRAPVATRRATPEDVPALAGMLTRAFLDDPVAIWSCRPERLRPRVLERFQATRLRHLLAEQEVWTTPELSSAALWAPPKRWRTTVRQDLEIARSALHPRLLTRLPLLARGFLGMERKHPHHPPHWYLAVLGTEPAAQGQGLGSAVLGPVLEQCDADGVGAYLESSKERNIAFYARHGFRVTAELRLPLGPRIWAMWREARGAPASAVAS
jgi:ribosomal protein S18 acetylase RimI-like enzyme